MMQDQNEAQRLANALDAGQNFYSESSMWFDNDLADTAVLAATELRRLDAENAALREALRRVKHKAVSLADAQVIALEALSGTAPARTGDAA